MCQCACLHAGVARPGVICAEGCPVNEYFFVGVCKSDIIQVLEAAWCVVCWAYQPFCADVRWSVNECFFVKGTDGLLVVGRGSVSVGLVRVLRRSWSQWGGLIPANAGKVTGLVYAAVAALCVSCAYAHSRRNKSKSCARWRRGLLLEEALLPCT